jgi:hypothetical protein
MGAAGFGDKYHIRSSLIVSDLGFRDFFDAVLHYSAGHFG